MRLQSTFKLILVTFSLLVMNTSFAASINWQPLSKNVFAQAMKQHKMVLIFGKATWCPWCRRMKSQTYSDSKVIELVNKYYVPVMVDIDEDSAAASRYQMSVVPATIVLDSEGKTIDAKTGYQTASQLASFLSNTANS